jgi:uncharacterized protein
MKCPICTVDLVMSERQGIEIDYCPQCRGVWLDRGELDKIIERSAAAPSALTPSPPGPHPTTLYPPAPQPYRQEEHHHQGHGHKKDRKKSFFAELFD